MSLSLAFSAALSGLNLSARGAQIVADNIANSQTESYGVRTLNQRARVLGGTGSGVAMTGITRHMDRALIGDLRQATTLASGDSLLGAFWQKMETGLGLPSEDGSLGQSIARLGTALQRASLQPDQTAFLQQSIQAANDISTKIRGLHDMLAVERDRADAGVAQDIEWLNNTLNDIADLNHKIQRQTLLGGTPEGLMDLRQSLVDKVAQRIPVQEFPRDDGRIMLMARDGSILVDRDAAQFSFSRSPDPRAGDGVENGALSRVSINGREIVSGSVIFAEGTVGAFLQLRDDVAPAMLHDLDLLAADLVSRFSGSDIDQSLDPGDFGLFSLAGHTTLPAALDGIAGLLSINPALDPSKGGAEWRLRTGINATGPGDVLDNSVLDRMARTLDMQTTLGATQSPLRSLQGHATDLLSSVATQRLGSDQRNGFNVARVAMLSETLAAQGVDTDAELSKLLILEQAYSANARVLSTVDAMLRTILEI
ncbi:MAG: flagellar hook-associated protein FlgK [Natronohydrobacter sp.]|nr:flagellar hook-associated protein FlgK [Natronohydrobacter sp.]